MTEWLLFSKANTGTKGMERCLDIYSEYSTKPQQMMVSRENISYQAKKRQLE